MLSSLRMVRLGGAAVASAGAVGSAVWLRDLSTPVNCEAKPPPVALARAGELGAATPASALPVPVYDVAIVGGGIVGLATAREIIGRYPNRTVVVLEKEAEVRPPQPHFDHCISLATV